MPKANAATAIEQTYPSKIYRMGRPAYIAEKKSTAVNFNKPTDLVHKISRKCVFPLTTNERYQFITLIL
jgi:hypothetical protein